MATSSLILADNMGPASQEKTLGTGHFLSWNYVYSPGGDSLGGSANRLS